MKQGIGRALTYCLMALFAVSVVRGVSVFQCDNAFTELLLTNDADYIQHYSIQTSGVAKPWSTLTPSTGFTLVPGQSKVLVVRFNVPCSTEPGIYYLRIKAVSDEGSVIDNDIEVNVKPSHYVTVGLVNSSFTGCVNTPFSIPLMITNEGVFFESVNLTASGGVLSQGSLLLEVNDSQVVNLLLTPDSVGVGSVVVEALNSKTVVNYDSVECSFFNASLSSDYVSLCENEELKVDVNIVNGNSSNVFYFSSDSFFIDLPDSVVLGPLQSYYDSFTVYSGCERGVFNPIINVWSNGSRVVSLPLVLNFKSCYQPIVVSEVSNDYVCSCDNVSYSFSLYNPGNKSITYALTPSVGSIYFNGSIVDKVTLPVDGSAVFDVNYFIPCDLTGDLDVSLRAVAINVCNKSSIEGVNLKVNSLASCQSVSVNAPLSVPVNDSQFTVPVSVSNMGSKPTSYNLLVTGSAVNNLLGVSKSFLTLEPGQTEVVELVFGPTNITGGYVNVQAFSVDNLASDITMINFGGFSLSDNDFYYLVLPAGVVVLLVVLLLRGKFFNRGLNSNVGEKQQVRIRKAELKK